MAEQLHRKEVIQRIRVGLGGLTGVLLLIGLADIVVDKIRSDEATTTSTVAANATADATASPDQPTEPLAELGVTPPSDIPNRPVVADLQPDPKLREPMDRPSSAEVPQDRQAAPGPSQ